MAQRKKKKERDTHRGFTEPTQRVSVHDEEDESTMRDRPSVDEPRHRSAAVDVELDIEHIRESGSPSLLAGPWRAFEVWTRNRIYGVDGAMVCRAVTDRATGASTGDHPALGARLIGGQHRDADGRILWVSHPLPSRGGAAVFSQGMGSRLKVSETSEVTRVVVRQRVVTVSPGEPPPSWTAVTGD